MKMRKLFSAFCDTFAVSLFIFLTVFPKYATAPTRNALYFCVKTLVPSLFIYMILSKIIITLPATDRFAKRFGVEPLAFIAGNLCGCPIGAKNAISLYETGRIDKKHAEFLTSFTNNASVSFIIGFVGSELFGDVKLGVRIFVFQLCATFLTAVVMKYLIFGKEKIPKTDVLVSKRVGFREAVSDSAFTLINVCAVAVFFIVCGSALSGIFKLNPFNDAVLKSLFEFSSGCQAASKLNRFAIQTASFSVGFTGISVAMQVKSVISGKLSLKPFLTGKLLTCAFMTALSVIFG